METKQIIHKNSHIFAIIACVGLVFSAISIIRAANEGKMHKELYTQTNTVQDTLGQKTNKVEQMMQANEAINNHEYKSALSLISGEKSEDYYNRGTIQALIAYKHALEGSVSGLQMAQTFVAFAQQNFYIAKKLKGSNTIQDAITENQQTAELLSSVIDIKSCYVMGQEIVNNISDINVIIGGIYDLIDQGKKYIDKRAARLDNECEDKLRYIVDVSKEQVGLLKLDMEGKRKKYLDDLNKKIQDPTICLQLPYENILPSIKKGKKGLLIYKQLHQNTVDALKSDNKQMISNLCNNTTNDAQINQQIESSVQELLETLSNNTLDEKQKTRATNEKNHKDFFTEDEKDILQKIQDINRGRIKSILDIRGKGNYDPQNYLNNLFNQFYGNTGDFIDLHH